MTCKKCLERVKDWVGDDPACYFDSPARNWNCATVNEIREFCYEGQDLKQDIHYEYCDDEKFATFNIHEIEPYIGRCLYVAWYKQRGNTEALWILDDEETPRSPAEHELLAIIAYFKGAQ